MWADEKVNLTFPLPLSVVLKTVLDIPEVLSDVTLKSCGLPRKSKVSGVAVIVIAI
jgi:hypothetical protein